MSWRLLVATLVAASCSLPLTAQEHCPQERAVTVPASTTYGLAQKCAGVSYVLGGVQLTFPNNTCPTHLIYTPEHELAQPSLNKTRVELVKTDPVTMVTFRCRRDYLIIIPVGSTCVVERTLNVGTVMRLITVPCPFVAQA